MFCSRCGKAMTGNQCEACGQPMPLHKKLMWERTTDGAGDRRLLMTLRLVALLCAGAVAVMLAIMLMR